MLHNTWFMFYLCFSLNVRTYKTLGEMVRNWKRSYSPETDVPAPIAPSMVMRVLTSDSGVSFACGYMTGK